MKQTKYLIQVFLNIKRSFDRGWLDLSWYEFPQKLGFVNYSIGKIEFSPTGLMLIDENNKHLEQVIFSNALLNIKLKILLQRF